MLGIGCGRWKEREINEKGMPRNGRSWLRRLPMKVVLLIRMLRLL